MLCFFDFVTSIDSRVVVVRLFDFLYSSSALPVQTVGFLTPPQLPGGNLVHCCPPASSYGDSFSQSPIFEGRAIYISSVQKVGVWNMKINFKKPPIKIPGYKCVKIWIFIQFLNASNKKWILHFRTFRHVQTLARAKLSPRIFGFQGKLLRKSKFKQ